MFRRMILPAAVLLLGTRFVSAQIPPEQATQTPETWGPATGYATIMNSQLQGADPGQYYLYHWSANGSFCIGNPTAECLGYAQIQVPDGARLEFLDLWAYDVSSESDLHYAVLENCETTPGQDTENVLSANDLPASAGSFHFGASLGGATVNNADCGYSVRIKFTDSGEPPRNSDIRVRKLRVSWTRQVSPAPATASFGDVPTGHQFFQFVEALAKSGITAGCGGGNFCPDAPLTRGQMAAFLSKALGLQWP